MCDIRIFCVNVWDMIFQRNKAVGTCVAPSSELGPGYGEVDNVVSQELTLGEMTMSQYTHQGHGSVSSRHTCDTGGWLSCLHKEAG